MKADQKPHHGFLRGFAGTDSFAVKAVITELASRRFFKAFYSNVPESASFAGAATISFDCDHPKDIEALPHLLNVLDSYDFKASFACIGRYIEAHPLAHRMIVEGGHEIVNHTYNHPFSEELNPRQRFDQLNPTDQETQIRKCHEICERILDVRPVGFRIPHFGTQYTRSIYPILSRMGYRYSSSILSVKTESVGIPYWVDGILEFPVTVCLRHPFQAFDSYHAFRSNLTSHKNEESYFDTLEEMVTILREAGGYLGTYFDPRDIRKFRDFGRFLELISDRMKPMRFADFACIQGRET